MKQIKNPEAALNVVFSNYKVSARSRGIQFNLQRDEFRDLIKSNCYLCNRPPSNLKYGFAYNGLDRIDPARGYEIDNVWPCCFLCNKWKGTLSLSEMLEHVNAIVVNAINLAMIFDSQSVVINGKK